MVEDGKMQSSSPRSHCSSPGSVTIMDMEDGQTRTDKSSSGAIDLTKLNASRINAPSPLQQRTVICQANSSKNENHHIKNQPASSPSVSHGAESTLDLSLSGAASSKHPPANGVGVSTTATAATVAAAAASAVASGLMRPTRTSSSYQHPIPQHLPPAHSRIKKVLKHYQATADISINGPDWFLPIYNGGCIGSGASAQPSNTTASSDSSPPPLPPASRQPSSSSQPCLAADASASTINKNNSQTNNENGAGAAALELNTTKPTAASASSSSSSQPQSSLVDNAGAGAPSTTSTLDLRTGGGGGVGAIKHHHPSLPPPAVPRTSLRDFDPLLAPPPFPIQQPPLLTPPDQSPRQSERSETRLEGELIACFTVGGEKRLCVPQIFNIVLKDYSLPQINQVIEELQINCSTCTPHQMEVLKRAGDIPPMAPSCGLITKTDAHRLCSTLLGSSMAANSGAAMPSSMDLSNIPYILIYHECFGRCIGRYAPDLYTHPLALCIQCDECMLSFTPYGFVCHSHRPRENRTVHWGFDPNNWRSYLLPIEDLTYTSVNNLQLIAGDSKNLSQLLRVFDGGNKSIYLPCCNGGRKSLKNAADYQNKNIENIRLIMKEMKARFAKSNNCHNANSSHLKQQPPPPMINNKRKELFDGTPMVKLESSRSASEATASNANKRIKSEHSEHSQSGYQSQYPHTNGVSSLMSLYPFLQSYLTSSLMGNSKPHANPANPQPTNYLSALLTGAANPATAANQALLANFINGSTKMDPTKLSKELAALFPAQTTNPLYSFYAPSAASDSTANSQQPQSTGFKSHAIDRLLAPDNGNKSVKSDFPTSPMSGNKKSVDCNMTSTPTLETEQFTNPKSHMSQKMRSNTNCQSNATPPRAFSSSEQARAEFENRFQALRGESLKGSGYEVLKRNLSAIESLVDEIFVNLIDDNRQVSFRSSAIVERFKKQLFGSILDLLDETLGSTAKPKTEPESLKVEDQDEKPSSRKLKQENSDPVIDVLNTTSDSIQIDDDEVDGGGLKEHHTKVEPGDSMKEKIRSPSPPKKSPPEKESSSAAATPLSSSSSSPPLSSTPSPKFMAATTDHNGGFHQHHHRQRLSNTTTSPINEHLTNAISSFAARVTALSPSLHHPGLGHFSRLDLLSDI